MKEFNPQHFSAATQAAVLRKIANSTEGADTAAKRILVGIQPVKGASHQAFLMNADSPPFNGGTTKPRSGPGSDYRNRPSGAPVEKTDAKGSEVNSRPGYRHLNMTAFRAGVDGKPAKLADPDRGDTVKDVAMPRPESTRYKLLYETDDMGNYRSDGKGSSHAAHFNLGTFGRHEDAPPSGAAVDNGGIPPLSMDGDDTAGNLALCAEACDSAAGCEDNMAAREAFLNEALEHLDAACKSHRAMKRQPSAQVAHVIPTVGDRMVVQPR